MMADKTDTVMTFSATRNTTNTHKSCQLSAVSSPFKSISKRPKIISIYSVSNLQYKPYHPRRWTASSTKSSSEVRKHLKISTITSIIAKKAIEDMSKLETFSA
eukprot:128765_1